MFYFVPKLIGFTLYKNPGSPPYCLGSYEENYNYVYGLCQTNFLDTDFKMGGIGVYRNSGAVPYAKKSSDGKTFYWYAINSTLDTSYWQFNIKDNTYFYYAIG